MPSSCALGLCDEISKKRFHERDPSELKAIFAYVCSDFQAKLVEMDEGIEQQALPKVEKGALHHAHEWAGFTASLINPNTATYPAAISEI